MAEERNSSEVCPGCGEIAFTPEQLDMVYGYRIAQRNLRSDASGRLSRRGNIVDSAV